MEQVAKSSFTRPSRNCIIAAARPRVRVQTSKIRLGRQHIIPRLNKTFPVKTGDAAQPQGLRNRRLHAPCAVQQQEAATVDPTTSGSTAEDTFLIDTPQLRQLAESKGSQLFDGASVASMSQLANTLRTSLEFGLITDDKDLQERAAVFGSNTLPAKEEVWFSKEAVTAWSFVCVLTASWTMSFGTVSGLQT